MINIASFNSFTTLRYAVEALEEFEDLFYEEKGVIDHSFQRRMRRLRKENELRRKKRHLLKAIQLGGNHRGQGLEYLRALRARK